MDKKELEQLKKVLVKASNELAYDSRGGEQAISNLRMFAGNDRRILNRVPFIRKVRNTEGYVASQLEQAVAAITLLEEAMDELHSM